MAIDQQLYAIKDNSIWQSKTHNQYADQSDWTNYHVREDETGAQRITAVARGGDDVAETTKDTLIVFPNTDKEARFAKDKWIYMTSSEFPDGKRITLGEKQIISDVKYRHLQSNPTQNFIEGHSLHKETVIPISRFDSVVYKKRSYGYFYESSYTDEDGNEIEVKTTFEQDSPFPGDDTGKCIVAPDFSKSETYGYKYYYEPKKYKNLGAFSLYWYNDNVNNMTMFADKNRYYSFNFKIPEDFGWEEDDNGNKLPTLIAIIPLYRNITVNKKNGPTFMNIYVREDGHFEYKIGQIFKHGWYNLDNTSTSINNASSEESNQEPNLCDNEWHNMVINLQDDKSVIIYVDNYEYIREKVLDLGDITKDYCWDNLITLAPSKEYGIKTTKNKGIKFAQVEIYNDSYNPDKDDYKWLTKPSSEYYNQYVQYDISGNKLTVAPKNVYRQTDITLWCSMAPDEASIEDHWEVPTEENFYISESDAVPTDIDAVQPIDTVTRQYKFMYRRGRSFAIKYTCDLGDIIKPYSLIQLNA